MSREQILLTRGLSIGNKPVAEGRVRPAMFRSVVWLFCLVMILCGGMGCQSLGKGKSLSPSESHRANSTQDRNDPWIDEFGTYARKEHAAEPVADPLKLRSLFTSEQTRSIERNLGIGE